MTYRGHVIKGIIVLNPPIQLPEGAEVEVRTAEQGTSQARADATWAEVFKKVIGRADGLPSDSSINHDHYLYGASRK